MSEVSGGTRKRLEVYTRKNTNNKEV
jgi:hypothetical protein